MKRILHLLVLIVVSSTVFYTGCSDSLNNAPSTSNSDFEHNKNTNRIQSVQCDSFNGIQHCTIGSTTLSLLNSASILSVNGFVSADSDGVRSIFSNASEWRQKGTFFLKSNVGNMINFCSKNIGNTTSTLSVNRLGFSDTLHITPDFIGSAGNSGTYIVSVYNDSTLAGSQGGVTNGTSVFLIDTVKDAQDKILTRLFLTSLGEYQWSLTLDSNRTIRLPNSTTILGNKIVMTVQLLPGQYSNNFQQITIKSNVDSLHITSESIIP